MLKKNVKLVFTVVLIGLIGFSSQTFAQDYYSYDSWSGDAGMQWWNNNVPQEYALSSNQITKINKIRAKSNKKILPLQNELRSLRMRYDRYGSGSDIQKIKSNRNKIRVLEAKISGINLATRVRIQKVLGKTQLTYFNNGGYGWWNMADDCWYSPNTMSHGLYGRDRMWRYHNRYCRW